MGGRVYPRGLENTSRQACPAGTKKSDSQKNPVTSQWKLAASPV